MPESAAAASSGLFAGGAKHIRPPAAVRSPNIDPQEAALGRPAATARRLIEASVSPNTRRAYAGALRRLDAWLDGRELDDAALAAYLAELHDAGRASSSASMAVAAACFRAKLAGQPTPGGERTARPSGHRAGADRCGDRRTAVHGRNAP